jgi:hypothetical protein
MDRMDLHLSRGFTIIMVVAGLFTCGMVPLILWVFTIKDYPKSLDTEGITLKSGERLLWKDLTQKRKQVSILSNDRRIVTGVSLHFGKKHVKIAPQVLAEGYDSLRFISGILGEDLTVG